MTTPTTTGARSIPGCHFGTAIERYWTGYARIRGRASRSEYWLAFLCNAIIYAVLGALSLATGSELLQLLSNVYAVATAIPNITITVRRLHDANISGLFLLLIYGMELVGIIVITIGAVGVFGLFVGIVGDSAYGMVGGALTLFIIGIALVVAAIVINIVLTCLPSKSEGVRFD